MPDDVEMLDTSSNGSPLQLLTQSPPPSSEGTSRRSSLAVGHTDIDGSNLNEVGNAVTTDNVANGQISINKNETQTSPSSPHRPIPIPILVHPSSPTSSSLPHPPASPRHSDPSVPPVTIPSSSKPASTATKPRSTKPSKPARTPSPSPPPPPPPPPLQTIRLDIKLGGPDNYEVDISRKAKETGQRPPTPTPVAKKGDTSESEEDDDDKDKGKDKDVKAKKRKKKNAASEYYDISDPFIDDSELAVDERTYFAQTKQQGFYVSSGEVALMKDKTPKKPKSKKASLGLATALNSSTSENKSQTLKKELMEGSRESPIALNSDSDLKDQPSIKTEAKDEEEKAGQKRKRYVTVVEGGKKRKVVDIHSFHPELQVVIEKLKEEIAKESWAQKGKFPPALKPKLADLAILAIRLDEYDEHFFNLMPVLFPYNKFTMSKLIKRTVFHEHTALLMERQDELLAELAQIASSGFAKAEEEWEKSVIAWDKRQEKARAEAADTSANPDSAAPTRHPTEEMEVDHSASHAGGGDGADGEGGKDGKDKKDHSQHPPAKKYRMTEQMKTIVWQLVLLSNECCRLENEKNTLEGSVIQVSDQGLRKVLYQKIVAAFPEGWMSSGQISRDVSAMKKKFEKEAMENEV